MNRGKLKRINKLKQKAARLEGIRADLRPDKRSDMVSMHGTGMFAGSLQAYFQGQRQLAAGDDDKGAAQHGAGRAKVQRRAQQRYTCISSAMWPRLLLHSRKQRAKRRAARKLAAAS